MTPQQLMMLTLLVGAVIAALGAWVVVLLWFTP